MKAFKRFLTILAATFLCLGIFAFASCGDNSDETTYTSYEFTIVDESDAPVEGVVLKLCEIINGQEANCTQSNPSDANGKITFNGEEKVYHIDVISAGYSLVESEVYTSATYEAKTIVVKAD